MDQEEYKKEYDKAAAELDEAARATTPRGADGKFTKAEETKPEPAQQAPEQPKEPDKPDPLEELRQRLDKAEKAVKDNQAWGTQKAQELAELKKERERERRDAQKPKILDANPELADAIRHVVSEPAKEPQADQWQNIVATAHPGIFDPTLDPELLASLMAKREALGQAWLDPLVAIREITAEKLAHAERQIGKRFAAEAAKLQKKTAMTVPGAGGTSVGANSDLDEKTRILNMTDAEFAREVRRVKGY